MNINGFVKWTKEPNSVSPLGTLLTKTVRIDTNNNYKDRLIRVYLPSTYEFDNPNKRFPVIYMFDGKNLFDDYTSFVGEWGIDETIEEFIKQGKQDYIVVGIDAPNVDIDRTLEMTPENIKYSKYFSYKDKVGYAEVFASSVVNIIKPLIDSSFYTLIERENTLVGGSSMGGQMSFLMGLYYPEVFSVCLNFSPAFFLHNWNEYKNYVEKHLSKNTPKMLFYVGGKGFEALFVNATKRMHKLFLSRGLEIDFIFDEKEEHNEKAWRHYFPIMLDRAK